MDSQRLEEWREADRLFQRLMDLEEPARSDALAASGASAPVRAKLETMLSANTRKHRLLDSPGAELPWVPATSADAADEHAESFAGRRLGHWKLIELIGRGGMAVVFRGELVGHDYSQEAAIKLLGVALRGSVQQTRFRREQRILAQLQHPHIASLIDAGVGEDGTPYLAMSLINGERIDRYCDAHELSVNARVQLLLQVCTAVAYAHRQLVIHRDIKPGNILVDASGHVTLLDFGVARLLDVDTTGEATVTHAFTPDYAAPEQRQGTQTLGTPVDVFGLGAVLHRLLTGAPPRFDAHGDPLPASTVARERDDTRGVAPLRGDIDAIIAHALAVDPDQRYPSVDALADDLRAWIEHRPLQARPVTAWTRLRKCVRRNRVASALVVVAILAVASTITAIVVSHNELDRRAAQLQTVVSFQEDMLQQIEPQAMGAYLRRHFAAALTKIPDAHAALADATLAKVDFTGLGVDMLNHALLDPALVSVQTRFASQPRVRAMLLQTLANIYRVLFEVDKAEPVQTEATTLFRKTLGVGDPQTLASMRDQVKLIGLMQPPDGEARIRAVLALHERYLGPDDVNTALVRTQLGAWYIDGNPKQAEKLLRQSSTRIAQVLGNESPELVDARGDLAMALAAQNHFVEAARLYRQAIDESKRVFGPDAPATLDLMNYLAWTLGRLGHDDEAHARYQRVYEIDRRVFGDYSPRTLLELNNVAAWPRRHGDYAAAEPLQRKAWLGMRDVLGPNHPQTLRLQANLAEIDLHLHKLDEAARLLISALHAHQPANHRLRVAQDQRLLGQTWQAMGKAASAEHAYAQSWQAATAIKNKDEQRKSAQALVSFYSSPHGDSAKQAYWADELKSLAPVTASAD